MIKKIAAFCFALVSIVSVSAQKDKVVIDAVIKDLPVNSVVYWTMIGSGHDDSVVTVKGGFHIEIPMKPGEGNIYIIQIGEKYSEVSTKALYLDQGNVLITGDGPQFKDVKLSGSQYAIDLNNFLEQLKGNTELSKEKDLYAKEDEFERKNDTLSLKALEPQLRKLDSIRVVISKNWIGLHPASPISAYVLYNYMKSTLSMTQLDSALNQLSPEAKNNMIAKGLANSIRVEQETVTGKPAFAFTQRDTSGRPISLKDFRGKYVFLDFWASWCQPCRMENPNLVAAYKKFGPKKFTVISISIDMQDQKSHWLKAIRTDGLTWTNLSDLKGWNNAVAKLYDIQSVPSNFLINPEGIIVAKDLRGDELDKKLSALLSN